MAYLILLERLLGRSNGLFIARYSHAIEFWSGIFPYLSRQGGAPQVPPSLESRQDGIWPNVRHFALKGFIYIDISLRSVKKRHPRVENFTTNKTHGLKEKFQKRVVKILPLDILSGNHQSRPSLIIIFLACIPHRRFWKRRYPRSHELRPSK